jgi:uncharacterized protein (DUF2384 family)
LHPEAYPRIDFPMKDPQQLRQVVEAAISRAKRRLMLVEKLIGLDDEVVLAAVRAFKSLERAHEWLITPAPGLDGRFPVDAAMTLKGQADVISLLGRIDADAA